MPAEKNKKKRYPEGIGWDGGWAERWISDLIKICSKTKHGTGVNELKKTPPNTLPLYILAKMAPHPPRGPNLSLKEYTKIPKGSKVKTIFPQAHPSPTTLPLPPGPISAQKF